MKENITAISVPAALAAALFGLSPGDTKPVVPEPPTTTQVVSEPAPQQDNTAILAAIERLQAPQVNVDLKPLQAQIASLKTELADLKPKPLVTPGYTGAAVLVASTPASTINGTSWCGPCNDLVSRLMNLDPRKKWKVGTAHTDDWRIVRAPTGPWPRVQFWVNGSQTGEVVWGDVGSLGELMRMHPRAIKKPRQASIQWQPMQPRVELQAWTQPVQTQWVETYQMAPQFELPQVQYRSHQFGLFGMPVMGTSTMCVGGRCF